MHSLSVQCSARNLTNPSIYSVTELVFCFHRHRNTSLYIYDLGPEGNEYCTDHTSLHYNFITELVFVIIDARTGVKMSVCCSVSTSAFTSLYTDTLASERSKKGKTTTNIQGITPQCHGVQCLLSPTQH